MVGWEWGWEGGVWSEISTTSPPPCFCCANPLPKQWGYANLIQILDIDWSKHSKNIEVNEATLYYIKRCGIYVHSLSSSFLYWSTFRDCKHTPPEAANYLFISFDSVYFLLCIGSRSIFWNLTKNTSHKSIEFTKYLNMFLIWHRFLNILTFWMFFSENSFVSILLTICYSKYNAIFQQLFWAEYAIPFLILDSIPLLTSIGFVGCHNTLWFVKFLAEFVSHLAICAATQPTVLYTYVSVFWN